MTPPAGSSSPSSPSHLRNTSDTQNSLSAALLASRKNKVAAAEQQPVGPGRSSASSAFRNVSACNRCRHRKNRCDQQLPACSACTKAGVKCVGFDPLTKRELPRSYVYYLETRQSYLESLLDKNGITYESAESFALGDASTRATSDLSPQQHQEEDDEDGDEKPKARASTVTTGKSGSQHDEDDKIESLVSNIGLVSVQGASDSRFLGSASGISFARVVFAAVKSAAPRSRRGSERSRRASRSQVSSVSGEILSMRDSFFGLHTKPTIKQAPFPDQRLGKYLVDLYFEHANPQIPTLHRGEFMKLFDKVYTPGYTRTSRELYFMNIVFAMGAGIIVGKPDKDSKQAKQQSKKEQPQEDPDHGAFKMAHSQPEEYHAAAIVHLEGVLGSAVTLGEQSAVGGGLEELQAVLLLAGFALLRPVAPGLWYIVGVAVRLGIDLGLHYDDAVHGQDQFDASIDPQKPVDIKSRVPKAKENVSVVVDTGRQQWTRDFRRRLWWCVYSFDRLVSTCVGRPFGVSDQVITTPFPSLLDDKYINLEGFIKPEESSAAVAAANTPSYKHVAYHYFRLRLLQSEILQVLQYQQAQRIMKQSNRANENPWMHTQLPSPFLSAFMSFRDWRTDMDRRLFQWKESAPSQQQTGVAFQPMFLELNYWQAVILLYRQGLTAPPELLGHVSQADDDVGTPPSTYDEEPSDQEFVLLKIAEAGQRILKLYRQLHRLYLVNYTYLATHHLFMAGICFLYSIWHSVAVRSHLSVDDVDFTVLAATSVLDDLTVQCPPAATCRDAFAKMSKATIQMCMRTTGFGPQALNVAAARKRRDGPSASVSAQPPLKRTTSSSRSVTTVARPHRPRSNTVTQQQQQQQQQHQQQQQQQQQQQRTLYSGLPLPSFDMNLRELFTEQESLARPFGTTLAFSPAATGNNAGGRGAAASGNAGQGQGQEQAEDMLSFDAALFANPAQYQGEWYASRPDFARPGPAPPAQGQTQTQAQGQTQTQTQGQTQAQTQGQGQGQGADFYNLDFLDEAPFLTTPPRDDALGMDVFGMGSVDGSASAAARLGGAGAEWGAALGGANGGFDLFDGFFFGGPVGGNPGEVEDEVLL